jgi:hypothetical protein
MAGAHERGCLDTGPELDGFIILAHCPAKLAGHEKSMLIAHEMSVKAGPFKKISPLPKSTTRLPG